jgi:hypothetical protein
MDPISGETSEGAIRGKNRDEGLIMFSFDIQKIGMVDRKGLNLPVTPFQLLS